MSLLLDATESLHASDSTEKAEHVELHASIILTNHKIIEIADPGHGASGPDNRD